jgi:hypothetical protein
MPEMPGAESGKLIQMDIKRNQPETGIRTLKTERSRPAPGENQIAELGKELTLATRAHPRHEEIKA